MKLTFVHAATNQRSPFRRLGQENSHTHGRFARGEGGHVQLRPRAPASAPGEGATCPASSRSSQAPASGRPTSASSSARLRRSIRSTTCTFGRHALTSALESLLQQARCHLAALARLASAQALRRQHWLRLQLGHQLWRGLRLRRQPRLRPDSTPASAELRRQLGFDQSCGLGSSIEFTSARPAAGGRPRSNRAKPPSAHGAPSAGSSCMFYECRYEVKHNLAKTATHGEGTARPLLRPSNRPTTARAAPGSRQRHRAPPAASAQGEGPARVFSLGKRRGQARPAPNQQKKNAGQRTGDSTPWPQASEEATTTSPPTSCYW